jgi:hypothetical protein
VRNAGRPGDAGRPMAYGTATGPLSACTLTVRRKTAAAVTQPPVTRIVSTAWPAARAARVAVAEPTVGLGVDVWGVTTLVSLLVTGPQVAPTHAVNFNSMVAPVGTLTVWPLS